MSNVLCNFCHDVFNAASKITIYSCNAAETSRMYASKDQSFFRCPVCCHKGCGKKVGSGFLKKTLTMILMMQLSLPPSLIMAMERGDEETSLDVRPALMAQPKEVSASQVPALTPLTKKLQDLYTKSKKMLPKLIDDPSIASQSMDDYYVNLQIVVDKGQEGEKRPIELTQLFDEVENQQAAGKVLITGGAGIGKSTLLDRIVYDWAQGKLFNDKFDYVFTVRLKKLTTDAWRSRPTDMDDPLETLMCESLNDQAFIHKSALTGGSWARGLLPKDDKAEIFHLLTDTEKRSRVLLLLDGYDEVANLAVNIDHIASRVLEDVYTYPYMVVTSRPNALHTTLMNKFGRKVESTGLSQSGVSSYINQYFTSQAKLLGEKVSAVFGDSSHGLTQERLLASFVRKKDTLSLETLKTILAKPLKDISTEMLMLNRTETTHLQSVTQEEMRSRIDQYYEQGKNVLKDLCKHNDALKAILTVPINTAMACFVSTDPDFSQTFSGDFNIGQLYEAVIVWLGKRFENKFHGKDVKEIVSERIFSLNEVRALEHVAYEGFKDNKPALEGMFIDRKAREINQDLTLDNVIKYGLLKLENTNASDDIIDQDHAFIHLSFQEYMMAHLLKEQLLSENEDIFRKAAQFIANHRNEPRYQMTLKLLAGLVNSQAEHESDVALMRFWEAMVCNVDGVLELGVEIKVKLLMHLLGQSRINGQINPHIHYLNEIENLINPVVLKDIPKWEETIIQSGYVSEAMVQDIQETLIQGLLSIKSNSTFDKSPENAKLKSMIEIMTCLSSRKEFGRKEQVLNKLLSYVKKSPDWKITNICIEKLTMLIDETMDESIIRDLSQTIIPLKKESNFTSQVEKFINVVKKSKFNQEELSQLVSSSSSYSSPSSSKKIETFVDDDEEYDEDDENKAITTVAKAISAEEAFSLLIPLLADENGRVREGAATSLSNVVIVEPKLAQKAFSLLIPLLADEHYAGVSCAAATSLSNVVIAEPKLAQEAFSLLIPFLKGGDWCIRRAAKKSFLTVVKEIPAEEAFSLLIPLLSDENEMVREATVKSLTDLIPVMPLSMLPDLLEYSIEDIRKAGKATLIERLSNAEKVKELRFEDFITLLNVVSATDGDAENKNLNTRAKTLLKERVNRVKDEDIAWINKHFENIPHSSETLSFLKYICHESLKDGKITVEEKEFILKCIKKGVTLSVTRDGNVILDEVTYKLLDDSQQYLDDIIKTSLNRDEDAFAQQYMSHQPLFINKGTGLLKAASDILDKDVKSLSGKINLITNRWLLTSFEVYNNFFMLLEKRNFFGDHLIYHYDEKNNCIRRESIHPEKITREMRESFFPLLDNAFVGRVAVKILEEDEAEVLLTHALSFHQGLEEKKDDQDVQFFRHLIEKTFKVHAPEIHTLTKIDLLGIPVDSVEAGMIKNALAIHQGGVLDRATVKAAIENLERESIVLSTYYRTFYWAILNLFDASRMLSTGKFQGNTDAEMSSGEGVAVKGAKKLIEYGAEVAKGVPMIGSIVGLLSTVIDDICGVIKDARFANKVNSITKIIQAKLGMVEDISINLAKVGLAITQAKKEKILNPSAEKGDDSGWDTAKTWLGEKMQTINQVILGGTAEIINQGVQAVSRNVLKPVELYDENDLAVKMALEDVTLTMAYLIQNYQSIIDNKEALDVQMARIVTDQGLEKLLANVVAKSPGTISPTETDSASVFNPITEATGGVRERFEISDSEIKEKGKSCCTLM